MNQTPESKAEFFQNRFSFIAEIVKARKKPFSFKRPGESLTFLKTKQEKSVAEDMAPVTDDSTLDEDFNTETISPMMRRCVSGERGKGFRVVETEILTPAEKRQIAKERAELRKKELFLPHNDASRRAGWIVPVGA